MMDDEKLREEGGDEEVQNVQKSSKIPNQDSHSLAKVSESYDEGLLKDVVHDSPKNMCSIATVLTKKEDDQWTSKENDELEGCVLPIALADDKTSKENIDQEMKCQQKQTKEENKGLQEKKGQGLSLQIPAVDDNQGQSENNEYHGKSSIYIEDDKGWKRHKDQDDDKENNSLHRHLEKDSGELEKDCSSPLVLKTNEQESYSLQKSSIEDTQRHLEDEFDAFSLRKLFGEDDQTIEEEIQKGVSVKHFFKEECQNTQKNFVFTGSNNPAFPTKTHKSNFSLIGSASFRDLKRSPQVETQHLMKKYVCNICKKWSLYWNVCRDCNIFLCDGCMKRNHSPVLQHAVTRYMGFSEFGCLDHIEICHYFCLDCTCPRCEACKITRCRHHYLTKDLRKREDKYGGDNSMQMRDREKPTSLIKKNMAFKWPRTSSGGSSDHCRYCFTTHERYNLCEDCLDFFCDSCLENYHPPGHTVSKRIPFSVFACGEHKAVYRYFCNRCKELRCEDCILMEGQCSDHADMIEKSLKHMAHDKTKFEEMIDSFSTKSSQTIGMIISELDQIEEEFSMRAILSRDLLRQEMASIRSLITEKESQLFEDFEKEYQRCMDRIQDFKERYGNLLEENGQLISRSLQGLRKNNLHAFYFSAQKMWSRLEKHKKALDSLSCPDDVLHSPILAPFSLCDEKKELENSLQIQSFGCPSLVCNNHTVYYKDYSKPLQVNELVSISNSKSTTFSLSVEIRSSLKDILWKSDHCSLHHYIANVFNGARLKPMKRYLIKFSLQQDKVVLSADSHCNVLLITGNYNFPKVPRTFEHPKMILQNKLLRWPSCSSGNSTGNRTIKFHNVHGDNVKLLHDNTLAKRENSYCKAICFSSRPIAINEKVLIRFVETSSMWGGVLSFGFTNIDPGSFRGSDLPQSASPDMKKERGCWVEALEKRYAVVNNVLHFYVTRNGDVMYGINGRDIGLLFSGVSTLFPLWALLDIYGNTISIEFVNHGKPPEMPLGIPHPEFPPKNFTLFGWPLKVSDVKKATTFLGTNDGPKIGFGENNYRCNEIVNFCGKKSLEELRAEDYLIKELGWNGKVTEKFRQRIKFEGRFCCISAMENYEMYSFEELRLQDYISSGIADFCGIT